MNRLAVIILSPLLLLAGCETTDSSPDFQIVTTVDGKVYRLDNESGEVFVIINNRLMKVPEGKRTKLVIGEMYDTEDGKVLTYSGLGEFKEKPLSEFTTDELLDDLGNM